MCLLRVTRVPLEAKPDDLEIPEDWESRLRYCESERCLIFYGMMSRKEKRKTETFSKDPSYFEAIDTVFQNSRNFLNKGAIFVSVFRWILLLLTALMFEKISDGICYRVTGETFFATLKLALPLVHKLQGYSIGGVEWDYVIGVLQLITMILLLTRYFLCLIDPIWRRTGISKDTDFNNVHWIQLLSTIRPRRIFGVAFISSVEFVLFYHAALSIPNINQWLHFLLLLILADTVYFLIIPALKSLHLIALFFVGINILILSFILLLLLSIPLIIGIVIWNFFGINLKWEQVFNILTSVESKFHNILDPIQERIGSIWRDYGPWNFLDLLTIAAGMLFWRHSFGINPDLFAASIIMILTVVVSIWNFFRNRDVYYTHINVLKLKLT